MSPQNGFASKMLCVLASGLFLSSEYVVGLDGPSHNKVVVCYMSSWAAYRPKNGGAFIVEDLDASLCTHLVYAFAGLNATSNTIQSLDKWQDLKDDYGLGGYERITALKSRFPRLKVNLAIGGWNEGSTNYSKMAATPASRRAFVLSVVQFLRRYGFDGLDLDWEYPAKRGGEPQDRENFVTLVKELKEEFKRYRFILTSAIGAAPETIDAAYDVVQLSQHLDFLHLMCYDYHGTWDGVVGPNAPLRGYDASDKLSVENTILYMLKLGAPPEKLVMGLPMYGRTFVKEDPLEPNTTHPVKLGQTRAKSAGFQGPFTKEAGFLGYNEICLELSNSSAGWEKHWDEGSQTPFITSGEKVICYDDERSIAAKVRLAIKYNLGGLMVWSMDTDDFRGTSSPSSDSYMIFSENLQLMRKNKYFREILPDLEANNALFRNSSFHSSSTPRSSYKIVNGEISLSIMPRHAANYALMRTIDESIPLAQQEKALEEALERKIREKESDNEIPQQGGNKKGAATRISGTIGSILLLAAAALILY